MEISRARMTLFFAADGGGVQRVKVDLANELVARGIDVDCVLPEAEGPFLKELAPEVGVIGFGGRSPWTVLRRLTAYIKEVRPYGIVASQEHTALAAIWARSLARTPTRLTIMLHNPFTEACAHEPRFSMNTLMPPLARVFYKQADWAIAVSRGVANDVADATGFPRERISVIYNPAVPDDVAARAARPADHRWLAPGQPPVVLSVGRLTEQKDFPTLVRAFARVRRERDARLIIMGEGKNAAEHHHHVSELTRLAAALGCDGDVEFPGYVDNPFAWMARAAVFALSSIYEGFGNVIAEALACGCPVVATRCPGGPAEILGEGDYGEIVPVGDDRALSASLLKLLRAPPDPQTLKQRGELFTMKSAGDQYIDTLKLAKFGKERI